MNAPTAVIDARIQAALEADAARREAEARRIILARFPRTGPWLIEHPRVLRLVFKVRPSLRPEMVERQC